MMMEQKALRYQGHSYQNDDSILGSSALTFHMFGITT